MRPIRLACVCVSVLLATLQAAATDPSDLRETLVQQVEVLRLPRFVVQGMNVNQQIRYRVHSMIELEPPDEKGHRKVLQTIVATALVEADPLSYAVFTQSLSEMRGRKYVYEIDEHSKVVSIKGHETTTKTVDVERPKAKGVLVSNVIDEDGWKELLQLTLFQPPASAKLRRSFSRKATHDWGSLGSWYGKTNFVGRPMSRNLMRYGFKHQLEYIPPDKDDPPTASQLPFEVDDAAFQAYEAQGEIQYDTKAERVRLAREVFHARGAVGTTFLGVQSSIDLDERQIFTIKVERPEP